MYVVKIDKAASERWESKFTSDCFVTSGLYGQLVLPAIRDMNYLAMDFISQPWHRLRD